MTSRLIIVLSIPFMSGEAVVPVPNIPPGFDPTDPDIHTSRVPTEEFAELRRAAPVWWVKQRRGSAGFDDDGYWAVTRHADIVAVSKKPEVFSSWQNTALPRFREGMPRMRIDVQRYVLLNIDPPQHTKLRGVITRGFSPRAIGSLRQVIAERAERIVRTALEGGSGNFVADVAAELPLQTIADLLGVPQDDRDKIFEWTDMIIGDDEEPSGAEADGPNTGVMGILGYSQKMAAERRSCPRDDIVTKLISAQIDGHALNDSEFGFFVLLLAVAGNETTRNAISYGMRAFFDNPDQWDLFKAERPETAADEIVRWATPVTVFQRTAARDTEIEGQPIMKGDRVGLFYRSANFDNEVFDHPERFDITRSPNPHLSFGGYGTHYCMGAALARLEIELMFSTIADLMPDIRPLGEAVRFRSGWINGITELPVAYHAGLQVDFFV
jgi:cholest-4-en-3-one 26-monooxygenase